MLDKETILKIYIKDKQLFINSYVSEIKARYKNFKKFDAMEKYYEALSLWECLDDVNHLPDEGQIILIIEKTKFLTHIEPADALKIDNSKELINKITSKFKNKKTQYWMTPDNETFPKNTDQKTIAIINVFWFLVGRPVNFDLTLHRAAFSILWEKSREICTKEWDDHELYTEISHMSKNQFGDFLVRHEDSFLKILTLREIHFNNRFNRM